MYEHELSFVITKLLIEAIAKIEILIRVRARIKFCHYRAVDRDDSKNRDFNSCTSMN